jgi:hypothetical protein
MRVQSQAGDIVDLASAKIDLDTLAGVVSSNKAAVKAASGDFADGALATLGAKADAASTDSTTTNTGMSFIKGFVKMLADVWDSTNHFLNVCVTKVTGLSLGDGAKDSTTLRVITASDGPLNANLGATTDAAITSDATGTISGKLRGLVKIFADVWDATNHLFAMNVKQIGGQTPTLDNTSVLAVSMRGKNSVAGDTPVSVDASGFTETHEQYAPGYEDNTYNKAVVEHRYTYGRATADTLMKSGAGLIHTIAIAPLTATPTAGLLTIYDNTAESGSIIYSEWIFATDIGHSILLDTTVGTGIYVGYDATLANVQVSVSYR